MMSKGRFKSKKSTQAAPPPMAIEFVMEPSASSDPQTTNQRVLQSHPKPLAAWKDEGLGSAHYRRQSIMTRQGRLDSQQCKALLLESLSAMIEHILSSAETVLMTSTQVVQFFYPVSIPLQFTDWTWGSVKENTTESSKRATQSVHFVIDINPLSLSDHLFSLPKMPTVTFNLTPLKSDQ